MLKYIPLNPCLPLFFLALGYFTLHYLMNPLPYHTFLLYLNIHNLMKEDSYDSMMYIIFLFFISPVDVRFRCIPRLYLLVIFLPFITWFNIISLNLEHLKQSIVLYMYAIKVQVSLTFGYFCKMHKYFGRKSTYIVEGLVFEVVMVE